MSGIGRTIAKLALAALVVATADATTPIPAPRPPILLRLDGTLVASVEVARRTGIAPVALVFPGRTGAARRRWLAVEDARTVGPDTALDGKDVLAQLAPLGSQLFATGPEPLVGRLVDAAPGSRIRVEGLVHLGSRTYYLRSVRVGSDAKDDAW